MVPGNIAEPSVVKNWSYDEKVSWAESYGEELWRENGDDNVVSDFTNKEVEEDKDKAWNVVYDENENKIMKDLSIAADDSDSDHLIMAMREGFMNAYDEARS